MSTKLDSESSADDQLDDDVYDNEHRYKDDLSRDELSNDDEIANELHTHRKNEQVGGDDDNKDAIVDDTDDYVEEHPDEQEPA